MGLLLALLGSTLIVAQDWHMSHNLGDLAAILSAIAYAGSFLLNKRIRQDLATTCLLRWRNLFMSLWILPWVVVYDPEILPKSLLGYGAILGLAIFCAIIAQGIITFYLEKLPASFMSLVTLLDPPLAAILASIILSESMGLSNYFYFALVLGGIYLSKQSLVAVKPSKISPGVQPTP
jgi:drug/metabolite transporter (DMT)-like permease